MINDRSRAALQVVGQRLRDCCAYIRPIFRADVKITILVRVPGVTKGHALVTDETNLEDAIAALRQVAVQGQAVPALTIPQAGPVSAVPAKPVDEK